MINTGAELEPYLYDPGMVSTKLTAIQPGRESRAV